MRQEITEAVDSGADHRGPTACRVVHLTLPRESGARQALLVSAYAPEVRKSNGRAGRGWLAAHASPPPKIPGSG